MTSADDVYDVLIDEMRDLVKALERCTNDLWSFRLADTWSDHEQTTIEIARKVLANARKRTGR
jgi:hypothetical protein